VTSVRNKVRDLELIAKVDAEGVPWRLQLGTLRPGLFEGLLKECASGAGERDLLAYLGKQMEETWSTDFASFTRKPDPEFRGGKALDFLWTREDGIEVRGRVELLDDGLDARFTATAVNRGEKTVLALEYPIFNGIQALGGASSDDFLAHPVAGGFLFQNPVALFTAEKRPGPPSAAVAHGGLYRIRYPNGFGAPMQFFAYYKPDIGGFYFAAHDPHDTVKFLNFYSTEGQEGLTASFIHHSWGWERGGGLTLDYPILVGALTDGDWWEATERYRRWATATGQGHPHWCGLGTLRRRVAEGRASRWLTEEVGLCTFGMPASFDVSRWFDAFHAATGVPVFHVLGHDWPAWAGAARVPPENWEELRSLTRGARARPEALRDEGFLRRLAGLLGLAPDVPLESLLESLVRFYPPLWGRLHAEPMPWFPARLDPRNLAAIRGNGDFFAPFEFDFFPYGHDILRYGAIPHVRDFGQGFMCPATEVWRRFHAERDVAVVGEGADALYYDISASCAAPMVCVNPGHGHPVGFGRHMVESYRGVYRSTKEAASRARGRYVPQGTEVIIENFVGAIDFAQCRAGGGVQGDMEGEEFLEWQKEGRAVKIPLFSYVYHEYGPVLLDGWAKLSREFGEIFYLIAARVALEGGLLELNYEFSPLELFPGMEGPAYQLVYHNKIYEETSPHRVDPAKLEFLREVAEARTGFARDYLAYGRMVRPARVLSEVPRVTLDWFHYNDIHGRREGGRYTTESVVQVGWSDRGRSLGFLFVNLLAETSQTLTVEVEPSRYGLKGDRYTARTRSRAGEKRLGSFSGRGRFEVVLPPRRVVLLEVVKTE